MNLSTLEVSLFEHRLKRRGYRRHIFTTTVPLANLEAQPSSGNPKVTRIMVPCQQLLPCDQDASIALGVSLCSDYAHWLNKELELRRREEVRAGVKPAVVEPDKDDDDAWDWICCVC
jgi:hypothetical protein